MGGYVLIKLYLQKPIGKIWKQLEDLLTDGLRKCGLITVEYHLTLKKDGLLLCVTVWMDL
jgi:hypothetical protein